MVFPSCHFSEMIGELKCRNPVNEESELNVLAPREWKELGL